AAVSSRRIGQGEPDVRRRVGPEHDLCAPSSCRSTTSEAESSSSSAGYMVDQRAAEPGPSTRTPRDSSMGALLAKMGPSRYGGPCCTDLPIRRFDSRCQYRFVASRQVGN